LAVHQVKKAIFSLLFFLTIPSKSAIFKVFPKGNPPLDEAAAGASPKWPHLPTPGPAKAGLFFANN
jgi:hypothetical protein